MADTFSKGVAFYKARKYREALSCFLNADCSSDEEKNNLAYYIGLSQARLENYDDALMYLEQVVTNGTDREKVVQCTLALAVIYSLTNRSRMAEFELTKLEEMGVKSEQTMCTQAYVSWFRQDEDKAIEIYEQVLRDNPDNTTALNGLGYILADSDRDLTRALFLCKKAVDLSPMYAPYLDSLGWVYYRLGLFSESESFLKRALDFLPDSADIKEHLKEVRGARR